MNLTRFYMNIYSIFDVYSENLVSVSLFFIRNILYGKPLENSGICKNKINGNKINGKNNENDI